MKLVTAVESDLDYSSTTLGGLILTSHPAREYAKPFLAFTRNNYPSTSKWVSRARSLVGARKKLRKRATATHLYTITQIHSQDTTFQASKQRMAMRQFRGMSIVHMYTKPGDTDDKSRRGHAEAT